MRSSSLILLIFFSSLLTAQVGVNTPTPSQALDVMGKIQVSDDATPPERGTIRFNDQTSEFEGYNGREWKVLSLDKSSDTPTGPIPYGGFSSPVPVGNTEAVNCTFEKSGVTGDPGPNSFTQVPAGHYFIITHINVLDNNLSTGLERMNVSIRAGTSFSRFSTALRYAGTNHSFPPISGSLTSPLIILRPGENIRIFNNANISQTTLNVAFRGFLVEDLTY
ncbi:hypothetical protein [Neolewinella persica]|uniref:hypothetical protein n=1 Tax=Neolewinella persica TaxID=70998 RepID=UPI00035DECFF|nr:hypothetical protein [Neolewinella persica]